MLTAADIMTRSVVCAKPDDNIAAVARLLSDHDISAVPVCDASGTVIGMVSEGDLIVPVGEKNTARRTWWLHLLAEGTDLAPAFLDSIRIGNRLVRDMMVSPVVTASPETTVPQLADLLVKHHVKRLPIVKEGKLVGIVSRSDLAQAFARTSDAMTEAP